MIGEIDDSSRSTTTAWTPSMRPRSDDRGNSLLFYNIQFSMTCATLRERLSRNDSLSPTLNNANRSTACYSNQLCARERSPPSSRCPAARDLPRSESTVRTYLACDSPRKEPGLNLEQPPVANAVIEQWVRNQGIHSHLVRPEKALPGRRGQCNLRAAHPFVRRQKEKALPGRRGQCNRRPSLDKVPLCHHPRVDRFRAGKCLLSLIW